MPKIDDSSKLNALTQILQTIVTSIIAIKAGIGVVISSFDIDLLFYQSVLILLGITFFICIVWAVNVYLKIIKYLKS